VTRVCPLSEGATFDQSVLRRDRDALDVYHGNGACRNYTLVK